MRAAVTRVTFEAKARAPKGVEGPAPSFVVAVSSRGAGLGDDLGGLMQAKISKRSNEDDRCDESDGLSHGVFSLL
jgi:hypothetical protein